MKSVTASDFEKLHSADPKIKYGFSKSLLEMARTEPSLLYPYLDVFIELLENDNQILKWTAIDIIGLLSAVDKNNRTDKFIERFIDVLSAGKLITANHAIYALTLMALAKPRFKNRIISAMLNVEHETYETTECRNIVIGKVIEALKALHIEPGANIIRFLERETQNSRNATRKKAMLLLKKYSVPARSDSKR